MPKEGSPQGTQVDRKLGREVPGAHLKIARLLSPKKSPDLFSHIIGIPFEESQLRGYAVRIGGKRMPVLSLMKQLDLIGPTEGVPHLSVGGESQVLDSHGRPMHMDSNLARAYLVPGGYGVKGAGFIRYEHGRGQTGFGLDEQIVRDNRFNIGGGLYKDVAAREFISGNSLSRLLFLNTGEQKTARVFQHLEYQDWATSAASDPQTLGILIREDGRRGVPKKELTKAIFGILPTLTDFFRFSPDFIEADGHNAFLRNGRVIFTDYEALTALDNTFVDFMTRLSNRWFFEELRKQYPQFLEMYGLRANGIIDYRNLDRVKQKISDSLQVKPSGAYDTKKFKKEQEMIQAAIDENDRKAIVRYAMTGVVVSHANARLWGQEVLKEVISDYVKSTGQRKTFTLDELEAVVNAAEYPNFSYGEKGELVAIEKDANGALQMRVRLNVFGLPIEPETTIPVTHADIFKIWQNVTLQDSTERELQLPLTEGNPFQDIAQDVLIKTPYSYFSGLLSQVRMMAGFSIEDLSRPGLVGYEREAFRRGEIHFSELTHLILNTQFHPATYRLGDRLSIIINEQGDVVINSQKQDLRNLTLAEINKLAYAIHVTQEYLSQQGNIQNPVVTIETSSA